MKESDITWEDWVRDLLRSGFKLTGRWLPNGNPEFIRIH